MPDSVYPDALDSITDPYPTLKGPSGTAHKDAHLHLNDAVENIQTELGLNPSGDDASVAAALTSIKTQLANLTPAYWSGPAASAWLDTTNTIIPSAPTPSLDLAVSRAHVTRIGQIVTISADLKIDLSASVTYPAATETEIVVDLTEIGITSDVFSGGLEQVPFFPARWSPRTSTGTAPTYPVPGSATTTLNGGSAVITIDDTTQIPSISATQIRAAFQLTFRASL